MATRISPDFCLRRKAWLAEPFIATGTYKAEQVWEAGVETSAEWTCVGCEGAWDSQDRVLVRTDSWGWVGYRNRKQFCTIDKERATVPGSPSSTSPCIALLALPHLVTRTVSKSRNEMDHVDHVWHNGRPPSQTGRCPRHTSSIFLTSPLGDSCVSCRQWMVKSQERRRKRSGLGILCSRSAA